MPLFDIGDGGDGHGGDGQNIIDATKVAEYMGNVS